MAASINAKLYDGTTEIGAVRSAAPPGTLGDVALGGAADLWGTGGTLTAAFVNGNLRVGVYAAADLLNNYDVDVDSIGVTVYYTEPSGVRRSITLGLGLGL